MASFNVSPPPPNFSAISAETNDQVTASLSPRAASARRAQALAVLQRSQHGSGHARKARQRLDRHAVDAFHAHHLFDDVGFLGHVGPPGRHGNLDHVAGARNPETEPAQDGLDLGETDLETREALHFRQGEIDDQLGNVDRAGDLDLARFATAQIENHLGSQVPCPA